MDPFSKNSVEAVTLTMLGEKTEKMYSPCLCYDEKTEIMYIGGGVTNIGSKTKFLRYNTKTSKCTILGDFPDSRIYGSLTLGKFENRRILFLSGGMDADTNNAYCSDFYIYDIESNSWEFIFSESVKNIGDMKHISSPSNFTTYQNRNGKDYFQMFGWVDSEDLFIYNKSSMILFDLKNRSLDVCNLPDLTDESGNIIVPVSFGCVFGDYYYTLSSSYKHLILKKSSCEAKNQNLHEIVDDISPIVTRIDIRNPKKWEFIKTLNEAPSHHLSTLIPFNNNELVVWGGNNIGGSTLDEFKDMKKKTIYILDLNTKKWKKYLIISKSIKICRHGSGNCFIGSKLITFGGVSYDAGMSELIHNDMYSIDMNNIIFIQDKLQENDLFDRIKYLFENLQWKEENRVQNFCIKILQLEKEIIYPKFLL